MCSQVRSKAQYAAKRLAQAVFLRFGLETNHAGTRNQLESTHERFEEARRRLREARGYIRRQAHWQPADLRKLGFSPRTVVDVGVDDGTPALYEAFPEAFQVLIEPLKENEPHLQRILQEYEGEYFLTAVGARDEQLIINVEPISKRKSSIYPRADANPTDDPLEKRKVPVITLDTLLENHGLRPPFGLKIDTEGFEYQVIEGASKFLRETQFVIVEVNVAKRHEGSYSFAEFIQIMDGRGFCLCDILHTGRAKVPPYELRFVDAVFRRADVERAKGGG